MSGTDGETVVEAPLARRSRADRPEREVHRRESRPEIEIESIPDGPSPEEALAASRRQLQERDQQLAEARRREQAASSEAARAAAARTQDHTAVVGAAVETARAEKTAAIAKKRTAREAGDMDAELAADDELAAANFRLINAEAELTRLKAAPAPQQQQQGPSAAAQRWIDDHPAFHNDKKYHDHAIWLHEGALRQLGQKADGTQEYVDFIERGMVKEYGQDHARLGSEGRPSSQREESVSDRGYERGGDIAPSRRSSGTNGWKTVKTDLGEVQYQNRSDGSRAIRFSDRNTEDNFREGAMLDRNWERDPGRVLGEYVNEHIESYLEGGQDIKRGDGQTYGRDDGR